MPVMRFMLRLTGRSKKGQTVVEYLLTTMFLVVFFTGMYSFLQGQVRTLFIRAGIMILQAYY